MAWIKVLPPTAVGGELAEEYERIRSISGFFANILAVHSLNPAALRAHYDLYRTIMFGQSGLTRAQREMVAVVVSCTNACHY